MAPMAAALAVPKPMPAPKVANPAAIPAPIKNRPFSLAGWPDVCAGDCEYATATMDEIATTPIAIRRKLKIISRFGFTVHQHLYCVR
jgi:hypothetical protein